jgi:NAD dependent epimerase/dehydratase family enzyme
LRNLAVVIGYRTPFWQRRGIDVTASARPKTILVTGGTGFIGRAVCRALIERGDTVIVWTRRRARATHLFGPYATAVETLAEIDPDTVINGVVNLAGEPVGTQLWTGRSKRRMIDSRVRTTRDLVRFIAQRRTRPDFMSELCRAWEDEAQRVRALNVRLCCLRIGFVLGTDGGSLPPLALSARLGLGAVLGGGAQWISWIHKSDMIALILFALDNGRAAGPFNATAPAPVTQADFAKILAKAMHRRALLRVPGAAMRVLFGDFADLLLTGQRVLPARAMRTGFQFRYPTLERALENLCATRADTGNARDASQHAEPATEET